MTYGFLTYVNGTFFIRRVGEHEYAFTDAVGPCDTDPTVLEMLMCEQGGRVADRDHMPCACCMVHECSALHPSHCERAQSPATDACHCAHAAWNLQT
jgi:hypothetical protein